ncbi:MAG: HEXXH motif-containing putative peptide modification protein [Cyclobacteriaceae bacterium]
MTDRINFALFKPFSHPFVKDENSVFAVVANTWAKNIVRLFFERHGSTLFDASSAISTGLRNFYESDLPLSVCWDPIIGKLEKFLEEEDAYLNNYLTGILCYLSIKGFIPDWKIDLAVKGDLFFDNYSITNCSFSSLLHDSRGKCITFSNDKGDFHLFYSAPKKSSNAFFVTALRANQHYPLTYAYLQDSRFDIIEKLSDFINLPKPTRNKNRVNEGLLLLKRHSPDYFNWVITMTKQVILYSSPAANQIKSGSWFDLPGIYNFSVNHEPLLVAEMLIHESSHQYFNLLKRFGEVATSQEAIYYSPAVNKMRPLWLILLAYHAFANVLIFYRILEKQNIAGRDQVKSRILETEPLVLCLEEHLVKSRSIEGLTPCGKALFEPLYEKLRSVK